MDNEWKVKTEQADDPHSTGSGVSFIGITIHIAQYLTYSDKLGD